MSNNQKAVVIGGAGFLGHRLVAMLCGGAQPRESWPFYDVVHVMDLSLPHLTDELKLTAEKNQIALTAGIGDIRHQEDVTSAIAGAHTVFHLASMVYVGLGYNEMVDAVNVEGTRNVVQACQALGVKALVYTSSEDVVLDGTPIRNGTEERSYPTKLIHDYVRTKIAGEKLALGGNDAQGLRTCSIRPVHIYGPGDPHALVVSLKAFAKGSVPFLLGDGRAKFDIVYVDNVVHAHLSAAERLGKDETAEGVSGQAFFIGEDNYPNYFDWLRPYAEAKGVKMPRLRLPNVLVLGIARLMEVFHQLTGAEVPFHRFHYQVLCKDFYFSNEKARRLLGYSPIVTPDEGERRTMEWLQSVNIE